MIRSRAPFRIPAMLPALLCLGFALFLSGCQSQETEGETRLRFKNPDIVEGMDSLKVYAIKADSSDTVEIYAWKRGDAVSREVKAPAGFDSAFIVLVKGFRQDRLCYESRSEVSDGAASPARIDFKILAPELDHAVQAPIARIGSRFVLHPAWKTRPGLFPEGARADSATRASARSVSTWKKGTRIIGVDTVLAFPDVSFPDSGDYLFISENLAGADSAVFHIRVKHALPEPDTIPDRILQEGEPLNLGVSVKHTDSLLYRWMRDGILVSTDSALSLPEPEASEHYRLIVKNASDSADEAVSNDFALRMYKTVGKWDEATWDGNVWQ